MTQEQVQSRTLAAGVQAVWHVDLQALLGVVRATAAHAVVVGELRVASVQAPAVASPRYSLCHTRATESLAAIKLLLGALVGVVQAAVEMVGAVGVAIAHPIGHFQRFVRATVALAGGRADGTFYGDIEIPVGVVTHVLRAIEGPRPAKVLVSGEQVLGTVLVLGTFLFALVLRVRGAIPQLGIIADAAKPRLLEVKPGIGRNDLASHSFAPPPMKLWVSGALLAGVAGVARIVGLVEWRPQCRLVPSSVAGYLNQLLDSCQLVGSKRIFCCQHLGKVCQMEDEYPVEGVPIPTRITSSDALGLESLRTSHLIQQNSLGCDVVFQDGIQQLRASVQIQTILGCRIEVGRCTEEQPLVVRGSCQVGDVAFLCWILAGGITAFLRTYSGRKEVGLSYKTAPLTEAENPVPDFLGILQVAGILGKHVCEFSREVKHFHDGDGILEVLAWPSAPPEAATWVIPAKLPHPFIDRQRSIQPFFLLRKRNNYCCAVNKLCCGKNCKTCVKAHKLHK